MSKDQFKRNIRLSKIYFHVLLTASKSRYFVWTEGHDVLILCEALTSKPYNFKPKSSEREKVWESIAAYLNSLMSRELRVTARARAVRDRYQLLSKKFKNKMAEEERASGISPEMTETDKLLEQIVEQFEESERDAGEQSEKNDQNKENERKKAEEMRNRSMEKLGETQKRKATAEDGQQTTPRKRSSGSETLVYLREKAEREFELRQEELEVKKKEQSAQLQMFQYMQQQLQQQQQQQQQQMQVQIQQQQLQNQMLLALIEKITK
ncbi:unnamed protein product [Pocillopora meandrina]|uniref:Myb/SANT-like DNA-binding domain-containing protein n=1 Tax=Pocillopora meandrina TaxID=46732 RepID=A0AAU9W6B8_9CNID|nr:unnamed protein product [Pocillopora meandrina]